MNSSHYLIVSVSPMAWISCNCFSKQTHYAGEEQSVPSSNASSLSDVPATAYLQGRRAGILAERQRAINESVQSAATARTLRLAGAGMSREQAS